MLLYENGLYQVHIVKDEKSEEVNYVTVNKLTGIVEDKTIKLPQALNIADALDGALAEFFKDGKGKFNEAIQKELNNGSNDTDDKVNETKD